jgi:hypothetical protein
VILVHQPQGLARVVTTRGVFARAYHLALWSAAIGFSTVAHADAHANFPQSPPTRAYLFADGLRDETFPRRRVGPSQWRRRSGWNSRIFVPAATFRVLFVLLILTHGRRRVVHFNVTSNPSAEWTANGGTTSGRNFEAAPEVPASCTR